MRAILFALAVGLIGGAAAFAQPPGPEVYGALPAVSDAALSPDGRKLMLAVASGGATGVRAIEIDSGREFFAAATPPHNTLRAIGWADDDHAIFLMSETVRPAEFLPPGAYVLGSPSFIEYFRTGIASIRANRQYYVEAAAGPRDIPPFFWSFIAPIEGDPGYARALGVYFGNYYGAMAVHRVSLESGRAGLTHRGVRDTYDFVLDERGEIVARVDADEETNRWRILRYESGVYVEILSGVTEHGAPPFVPGLFPDGRIAVIDDSKPQDLAALFSLGLDSGPLTIVHQDPHYPMDRAVLDPWTRRIVGVEWTSDFPRQLFFDAGLQANAESLAQAFADGYARILSWSRDRRRLLVFGEHADDAGAYYLYEPGARAMRVVARPYPSLVGAAHLGVRQAITYRARDGTRIPAYLTAPAGAERRNLPLVLLVHGGPHSRDSFAFDWWASFLASRGYAVLQANFRGSDGYGRAWRSAGFRQWGGLMQTDVEDGALALIRAGVVDPARVCIIGGSYGGYAALAGATLTPQRYACAASVNGVSDLELMLTQTAARTGRRSIPSDWWRLSIGDRSEDRARIRSVSPVQLAANVRAPILILHGSEDTVVPIEQSRRMERALRGAGKDVSFVELRGDDHWLSEASTRIQTLRELETFLAAHLGRRATPP